MIYWQVFNLYKCTFKSKSIYYTTTKCDDSVKTSKLCNNRTYKVFNGKSKSIYLKVPFILDIIEQECKNDEEIECSSSATISNPG